MFFKYPLNEQERNIVNAFPAFLCGKDADPGYAEYYFSNCTVSFPEKYFGIASLKMLSKKYALTAQEEKIRFRIAYIFHRERMAHSDVLQRGINSLRSQEKKDEFKAMIMNNELSSMVDLAIKRVRKECMPSEEEQLRMNDQDRLFEQMLAIYTQPLSEEEEAKMKEFTSIFLGQPSALTPQLLEMLAIECPGLYSTPESLALPMFQKS